MRKLQFVVIAAALMGGASLAAAQDTQQQAVPRGGRANMMAALMQGVALSAEQQVKVDAITKKYSEQRDALRADQNLDQDTRRAKGRELMGKQSDEIKSVLTDEQKKVFEKNQADMQARMQGGGGRPPQE
jgi:Spy/CpxP family protein refolding chaperone